MIFDPTNKRIILSSTEVDTKTIYSEWKRWVREGSNAAFLPAFNAVGGDSLGSGRYIPSYLFLLNGWRIRPMESNHTLHITGGQISTEDGSDPVVKTLGNFNVLVDREVPVAAIGVSEGGSSGATPAQIAAAVVAALNATTIPINVKKVNDVVVDGLGTESNPWGPA